MMFDISFGEIGIILIVMLLVLGPQKATDTARNIGKWIAKIKRMANNITTEINAHTKPIKETYSQIQDIENQIHSSVMNLETNKEYLYKKTKKPLRFKKKKIIIKKTLRKNIRT